MDKLEQKLKNYYQYHEEYRPEAISDEFLQRLKALESSPEAVKKPRRRYVLPVAAVLALALGVGGWTWARLSRSGDVPAQDPDVTLEEPSSPAPEDPAIPSKPATPEKKGPASPAPKAEEEQIPEAPASPTKPEQSIPAPPESGDPAPVRPDGTAPAAPEGTQVIRPGVTPVKPGETIPVKPADPTPEKPGGDTPAKPEADPPVKPDEPTPAEESSVKPETDPQPKPDEPAPVNPAGTDPQPPEDPVDPPEETPPREDDPPTPYIPSIITLEKDGIGAGYVDEDGRQTLVFTLMSTGECLEVDITGWENDRSDDPLGLDPAAAHAAGEEPHTGSSVAFGRLIVFHLKRTQSGEVHIGMDVIPLK